MSVRISPPHSPSTLRRCIICRETAPKLELLRVVHRPDGDVMLSTHQDGRGAYVHPRPQCLTTASSEPRHLARALRRPAPDAIIDQIAELAEAQPA